MANITANNSASGDQRYYAHIGGYACSTCGMFIASGGSHVCGVYVPSVTVTPFKLDLKIGPPARLPDYVPQGWLEEADYPVLADIWRDEPEWGEEA